MTRRDFVAGLGGFFVSTVLLPGNLLGKELPHGLKPLRIGFLTDCHAMAERGAPAALDRTAALMNRLSPDLIIGGGDFVHGGFYDAGNVMDSRWQIADAFLRKIKTRLEPVLGNHDFYEPLLHDGSPSPHDPRWRWKQYFGLRQSYRSFEFRGYRFLVLDSVKVTGGPNPYRGWIDAAQLAWLDRELDRIPVNQPIIVCSHIPFSTSARDALGPIMGISPGRIRVLNADAVMAKLRGRPVALILQGHVHLNERTGMRFGSGSIPCITGGSVCGKWWQGPNMGTYPGVGLIRIQPPGFSSPKKDVSWSYLDTPSA